VVSYWIYVLAGAIIIPNWLQGVLRNRRERKRQKDSQEVSH
jgi:hypothetical protein